MSITNECRQSAAGARCVVPGTAAYLVGGGGQFADDEDDDDDDHYKRDVCLVLTAASRTGRGDRPAALLAGHGHRPAAFLAGHLATVTVLPPSWPAARPLIGPLLENVCENCSGRRVRRSCLDLRSWTTRRTLKTTRVASGTRNATMQ